MPAQATTIKAQPSNPSPSVDSTMTVNIIITNVQDLFGVDIRLSWDAAALKQNTRPHCLARNHISDGVNHGTIEYALNQLT